MEGFLKVPYYAKWTLQMFSKSPEIRETLYFSCFSISQKMGAKNTNNQTFMMS